MITISRRLFEIRQSRIFLLDSLSWAEEKLSNTDDLLSLLVCNVRARQESFEAAADGAVALAGHLFEPGAICDGDDPPALRDQARRLEGAGDKANGGTLDTKHFC